MNYDYIVVGTGAGGGTITSALARSGASILVIERGDFLPHEAENWSPSSVFESGRYVSRDLWTDRNGHEFQPGTHYYVGGATKLYGAALYRLRPIDFNVIRYPDGISPSWPLSYGQMERWYSEAEQIYQVHGRHGDDPTEGFWSRQYPYPPIPHAPRIAKVADLWSSHGYHPFPAPCAVQAATCILCSTCDGHPCMIGAKSDAESIAIRPVMFMPNVVVVTKAEVKSVTWTNRRVTGVNVVRNGNTETYRGDTVILAAGAANTAKILLASNGLANSSDQVGRNFMMHNCRAVMAIGREPNDTVFQKTLALNDFYGHNAGYLGNIQMIGKSTPAAIRGMSRVAKYVPIEILSKLVHHSVDYWLTTEDLPRFDNRITLNRNGGIQLSYRPTNQFQSARLYDMLRTITDDGSIFISRKIGITGIAHQAGTCRMGYDPETSVVDPNCKAHDLDNLYITDASVMPSVGAVNPALTIIANSLRIANHLVEG